MKKIIASSLLCRSGLRSFLHRVFRWSGVLGINYHRIGKVGDLGFDRNSWSADADAFAEQLRFCKTHLDIIDPDDLPYVRAAKRGRHAIITFDDGYRDNYEVAFPILQREGVTATFFVSSGFIDSPKLPWWEEIAWMVQASQHGEMELPAWFDVPVRFDKPYREGAVHMLLKKYKALPGSATTGFMEALAVAAGTGRSRVEMSNGLWMTWDMLRKMQSAGMTIGGHSVTHPVLSNLPQQDQQREIMECGQRLLQELGRPMRYFSYPVGKATTFDSTTRACLRQAGVSHAFSYYGGYRRFDDWDDYDVRRVAVETDLSAELFRSIITLPQVFA